MCCSSASWCPGGERDVVVGQRVGPQHSAGQRRDHERPRRPRARMNSSPPPASAAISSAGDESAIAFAVTHGVPPDRYTTAQPDERHAHVEGDPEPPPADAHEQGARRRQQGQPDPQGARDGGGREAEVADRPDAGELEDVERPVEVAEFGVGRLAAGEQLVDEVALVAEEAPRAPPTGGRPPPP